MVHNAPFLKDFTLVKLAPKFDNLLEGEASSA